MRESADLRELSSGLESNLREMKKTPKEHQKGSASHKETCPGMDWIASEQDQIQVSAAPRPASSLNSMEKTSADQNSSSEPRLAHQKESQSLSGNAFYEVTHLILTIFSLQCAALQSMKIRRRAWETFNLRSELMKRSVRSELLGTGVRLGKGPLMQSALLSSTGNASSKNMRLTFLPNSTPK